MKRRKNKGKTLIACTRRQRKMIYEALKQRLPLVRALEISGITQRQYYYWMTQGKTPVKNKYHFFRKKVLYHQAQKEREALLVIEQAQKGGHEIIETKIHIGGKYGREITRTKKKLAPQWTAAAWYLERMYPEEYGLKQKTEPKEDPREAAQEIRNALQAMENSVPEED